MPPPLKLTHPTRLLPCKFLDHLSLFHGDGTVIVEEHLRVFEDACIFLDVHGNDSCMLLFSFSLQGYDASRFANLPNAHFSTWVELAIWFVFTFGNFENEHYHFQYLDPSTSSKFPKPTCPKLTMSIPLGESEMT